MAGSDRSKVRDNPWDPLARKGRWRVWNSRRGKPSWPAVAPIPIASTGRTYGCKRSDQTSKNSCGTGAVHIWVPAQGRDDGRLRRPVAQLEPLNLSCRRLRQAVHHIDPARIFPRADLLLDVFLERLVQSVGPG